MVASWGTCLALRAALPAPAPDLAGSAGGFAWECHTFNHTSAASFVRFKQNLEMITKAAASTEGVATDGSKFGRCAAGN